MNARLSLSALVFIVAAVIAVIVTTSGGSTSKAQPLAAANASISVKQTALGRMLTDANGRTLYLFAPDKRDMSTLSAAGRSVWPPFTSTGRPAAMGGVQTGQIGAVSGASGSAQVTYDGHPLYYFVGDRKPGETDRPGAQRVRWPVVRPLDGGRGDHRRPQPAAGGSSGGAPSYGY